MPINSGSFSKALAPGVMSWYGEAYGEWPTQHTDLFDQYTSRKAFEEDVGVSGYGLLAIKPEGQGIEYDTEMQTYVTRYTHTVYASGFVVTREAFEDDLYDVVGKRKAKGLAMSVRQTQEVVGANVYNRAFTSGYTGGDGVVMISASHPNAAGGTWSNTLSVATNISEAALEQARIDIQRFTNDRGLRVQIKPQSLIVTPEQEAEVYRILNSQKRVGTANNDANFIGQSSMFPGGVKVNQYLTSTTAWFVRTNAPDGMKHIVRRAPEFKEDNDFDTDNAKFKAQYRDSFGWTDPRAIYGTAGI